MPSGPGHPNRRDPVSLPVELRRAPVPPRVRAWVAEETGAAVQGVRRLPGASSTAVHALRLSTGEPVVLRRYDWPSFLEDEPIAPRREVRWEIASVLEHGPSHWTPARIQRSERRLERALRAIA